MYSLLNPTRSISCFINQWRSTRFIKRPIDRGKGSITFLLVNKVRFPLRFHFDVSNLNKKNKLLKFIFNAEKLSFAIYIKLLCNLRLVTSETF